MHGASGFDRIEVVTGVERRRHWSRGEKLKTIKESRLVGMSVSAYSSKIWYCSKLVIPLEKAHERKKQGTMRRDDAIVSTGEMRELKKRIRELECVLGKKALENEILTEAVKLAHEKN